MIYRTGGAQLLIASPGVEVVQAGGGAEWTPALATSSGSKSPLVWYKADAIAQGDATAVASWVDSSGNGKTLAQSTGGARPTYRTGIINGLPVVRCDGGDALTETTFVMDLRARTVFFVIEETTGGVNKGLLSILPAAGANNDYNRTDAAAYTAGNASNRPQLVGSTSTNYVLNGNNATRMPLAIYCERKALGGTGRLYQNGGAAAATDATYTEFASASGGGLAVGARWSAGALDLGAGLIGDIAEILIYQDELDVADTNQVGDYLERWGLAWTAIS